MRFVLALIVGFVGLPTVCVGDSRAQSILDELSGSNSQNLLLGPTQGQRKSDDTRNLSAPPSSAPPPADSASGSREISPSERQELLQNRTREAPFDWGTNRDRN